MSFGLSNDGFKLKRLPDIKTEIESDYRDIYGDIRTDAESVAGQQIGVISNILSLLWEQIQAVYYSQYPNSANGLSLDYLLLLNGLKRLPKTKTNVWCGLDVDNGSYLSNNFTVSDVVQQQYQIMTDETVNYNYVKKAYFEVLSVDVNTNYSITLSGYTHTVNSGTLLDTKQKIAIALIDNINNANRNYTADLVDGESIVVNNSQIFSFDNKTNNLKFYYGVRFLNIVAGKIPATVGTITTIITTTSGVNDVYNFEQGELGRDKETDAEARERRKKSLQVIGGATLEAIRTRLLNNINNISAVLIIENDTDNTVDNIPPHNIECIISGGNDDEIAQEIFNSKGAGIGTYGNAGVFIITDSQGFPHNISFSRALNVPIYVNMEISLNSEEVFPVDGVELIKDNIVDFGNNFEIGEDVIYQKFFGAIYKTEGVANVNLAINLNPNPDVNNPSNKTNILITPRELGVISKSNINVTIL